MANVSLRACSALPCCLLVCLLLPVCAARGQAVLSPARTSAAPGETLAVTYSGFKPEKKSAWIGFYRKGATDNDYISYTFLNNLANNTYDVRAPDDGGEYEFRIFADEGYRPLASSAPIVVGTPPAAQPPQSTKPPQPPKPPKPPQPPLVSQPPQPPGPPVQAAQEQPPSRAETPAATPPPAATAAARPAAPSGGDPAMRQTAASPLASPAEPGADRIPVAAPAAGASPPVTDALHAWLADATRTLQPDYASVATAIFRKAERSMMSVTDRELLFLVSRPGELAGLKAQLGPMDGVTEMVAGKAYKLRGAIFTRARKAMAGKAVAGQRPLTVSAFGSWAYDINPGDMDAIVREGLASSRELVRDFNRTLTEQVDAIVARGGEDLVTLMRPKGLSLTMERFEIFVSTLEDFGYAGLSAAYREALKKVESGGGAAAVEEFTKAAHAMYYENLKAQNLTSVQREYYAGKSGQEFALEYFSRPGKSRTWSYSFETSGSDTIVRRKLYDNKAVGSLTDDILSELGMKLTPGERIFSFARVAGEYVKWGEHAAGGAREQAKGLARAMASLPESLRGEFAARYDKLLACARQIEAMPRENAALVADCLNKADLTGELFGAQGRDVLWKMVTDSNADAMASVGRALDEVTAARSALANAEVKDGAAALNLRCKQTLADMAGNEWLVGCSKLDAKELTELARDIMTRGKVPAEIVAKGFPAEEVLEKLALSEQEKSALVLLEYMAQGAVRESEQAALMLAQLLRAAKRQGRLSAEAAEQAEAAVKAGKSLSKDVDEVIAGLRRDLCELANVRALGKDVASVEECVALWAEGRRAGLPGLEATDDLAKLLDELLALKSETELMRLGFREGEIAFLSNVFKGKGAKLDPAAVGRRFKTLAPGNWKKALRGYAYLGGAIAAYSMYEVANDPNIPPAEVNGRMAQAFFDCFPSLGLFIEGGDMLVESIFCGTQADPEYLNASVGLAGLEMLGLAFPAVGAVAIAAYVTYEVSANAWSNDQDRQLVEALYGAVDYLNDCDAVRTFDGAELSFQTTPWPTVTEDRMRRTITVTHSRAFNDLYLPPRGRSMLANRFDDNVKYTKEVGTAIREYARRNVWPSDPTLQQWEKAVRCYLPGIDFDKLDSWNMTEVDAQAMPGWFSEGASAKDLRIGHHLARRYINQRDLLTEAAIRQLKARVKDMVEAERKPGDLREQLKQLDRRLAMEDKLLLGANRELFGFGNWLWSTLFSSETAVERTRNIYKRFIGTYGPAAAFLDRARRDLFSVAGFEAPDGRDFYDLTGEEKADAPRIRQVMERFAGVADTTRGQFDDAKGGAFDPGSAFDCDAWARLLGVRLRQALSAKDNVRVGRLEEDAAAVLKEISDHYRDRSKAQAKDTAAAQSNAPPRKVSMPAFAYCQVPFILPEIGIGAHNLKNYAFYGAFFGAGAGGGMTMEKPLGPRGFAEVWHCKIPVTLEIEGDARIVGSGVYDSGRDRGFYVFIDPDAKGAVSRISLSGFPRQVGPSACEKRSNTAGDGDAYGDRMVQKYAFAGATNTGSSVSYRWTCDTYYLDDKRVPQKQGTGTASLSFGLSIRPRPKDLKPVDEPREVKLTASAREVKDASTVSLFAAVTGTKPADYPLKYAWAGATTNDQSSAALAVEKTGEFTVSCSVTDAKGKSVGSDSVTISANLAKAVEIVKDSPSACQVVLGQEARFHAEVRQDGRPLRADRFIYRWQPNSKVDFTNQESSSGSTVAKFRKLGPEPVWVDVLEAREGRPDPVPVADSQQIPIEVVRPKMTLRAEPPAPSVAQEVKVTASFEPAQDPKLVSVWWELKGAALNAGPLQDDRLYTFRPKDDKPVVAIAHAKSRINGDDLGTAKVEVVAGRFNVRTSAIAPGMRPRVYDPNRKEFIEVPKDAYATDENFKLRADVEGMPAQIETRWQWRLNEGTSIADDRSQTPTVSRHETGWVDAQVDALTADGILLGSGAITVPVPLSPQQTAQPLRAMAKPAKPVVVPGELTWIHLDAMGGTPPYQYEWTAPQKSAARSLQVTPTNVGEIAAAFTVRDSAGRSADGSARIRVEPAQLRVALTPDRERVSCGDTVTFRAAVKGGREPCTYRWRGWPKAAGKALSARAERNGEMRVGVDVTDAYGNTGSNELAVLVSPAALEVACEGPAAAVRVGDLAELAARVRGGVEPYSFIWSCSAGETGATAGVRIKQAGELPVTVRVTDRAGNSGEGRTKVRAEPARLAVTLATDSTNRCLGEAVTLDCRVAGGSMPYRYAWQPAMDVAGAVSTFIPDTTGMVSVAVQVTDRFGSTGRTNTIVRVYQPALLLRAATVRPGERVGVLLRDAPDARDAWIGFYERKADNRSYLAHAFLSNLAKGVYDVIAPDSPGRYEFRLFRDQGYTVVARAAVDVK